MSGSVIGALRVNLGLDSAQFTRGIKQAQSQLQQFGKRMAVVGAAISAAGAGIAMAVRSQLNAADQMSKDAQKIGIPVDELSRLRHAADMSGVSVGSLESSVRNLSRRMASSPQAFQRLGIAVRNANGEMRPTSEVMAEVADRLTEMPDGAEKTALAMELLGRSGADLIPMLNGGADALRGMMQEADDLGIVITPEMGRNAEQFNDNISRLTKQFSGLWTMISANLAPVLVRLSDMMVSLASRFRGLSPATQQFISILAGAIVVIGPVLSGLGLMIMTAGPLVAAMLKAAAAVKAVSMALLVNPIGLAVAAIAGAVYLIYQQWESVGPWFAALWDSVKAIFGGFVDFVSSVFTGDMGAAVDALQAIWDGLKAFMQGVWDGIVGIFDYAQEQGIKPIIGYLGATDAIESAWRGLQGVFDAVLSAISGAFTSAWAVIEPIYNALKWVWDNAAELGNRIRGVGSAGNGTTAPDWADVVPPPLPLDDMRDGLSQGTEQMGDQGEADADSYLNRFRRRFGINSPSREMMENGRHIADGLALGIALQESRVQAVSQSMADGIGNALEGVIQGTMNVKDAFASMLQDMASQLLRSGINRLIGGLFGASGFRIPGFANGVQNFRGGLATINERGGELVALPNGSTVIPHDLSRDMVRRTEAPTPHVHVTVGIDPQSGDLRAFVDQRMLGGFQQYTEQVLPSAIAGQMRDPRAR
ncbi:tail tape measure-like protein [Paracoccus phage Shpa]|uniref:Tail tape measure-like protein n=1 Tax=Paracoccus phage Shpa TaxID=1647282 RepID=A0A0U2BXT9_9CAUD|nr:tail length tape measure protein [Paracoccus phage Shpa]AKG94526.1 tail tape measure-like protein [Paracoccus phage Shpa]